MPPSAVPPSAFGFEQLVTELIRGVIEAVADRPGETDAQRFARHQTAVFSVMAFQPRDAVETMLAGQCVVFDHLLRDGARDLLRGQSELIKLRVRPQLNATGRTFLKHLEQLQRLRTRPLAEIAMPPRAAERSEPSPAADPEPAATPAEAPRDAKPALLARRGFQGRRARLVIRKSLAAPRAQGPEKSQPRTHPVAPSGSGPT